MLRNILFVLLYLSISGCLLGQSFQALSYPEMDSMIAIHRTAEQFDKAFPYINEVKNRAFIDFGQEDSVYANYVLTYGFFSIQIGDYQAAEANFLEFKSIQEKINGKGHPSYALSVNNLGFAYQNLSRFEAAEGLYLEGLELSKGKDGKSSVYYVQSLNNLAYLYMDMQNYTQAEKYAEEAKIVTENILGKKHEYCILTMNNLAQIYRQLKAYEKAAPLYQDALALNRELYGGNNLNQISVMNNLASLYCAQKKFQAAESLFIEAIGLAETVLGKEHPYYATTLNNLAVFYFRDSIQPEKSLDYFLKSLDANSFEIKSSDFNLDSLADYNYYNVRNALNTFMGLSKVFRNNFGSATQFKRDFEKSYAVLKEGIKLSERIRNSLGGQNKLLIASESKEFALHGLQAALLFGTEKYYSEALSFAEQNKSLLLAAALKGIKARTLTDLPDSLLTKEAELALVLDNIKQGLVLASSKEEEVTLNAKLNEARQDIDVFVKVLEEQYPRYHKFKYEQNSIDARSVQNSLDDKTLVLEYFVAEDSIFVFVIGKEKIELHSINVNKKELRKQTTMLRKALSDYTFITQERNAAFEAYCKSASWFYEKLLRQALSNKKDIANLVVIADDALGHLPFGVFLSKRINSQVVEYKGLDYLIKKYNISYAYSATLWKENLEQAKKTRTINKKGNMLAFASAYPEIGGGFLKTRTAYHETLRKELKDLPAAIEEVETLSKQFQGNFKLKKEAGESNFKEMAGAYSVIHLAMHGVLDYTYPILSSLAFTEDKDSLEDNFLHAYEIAHLTLNADLVVLSACETGYGKLEKGEGVMSLARSFMYAGIPSLVVSLWQVNDASTATIMNVFYQYIAKGMDKASALRAAKMDYLNTAEGIFAHPAFWAPFIQLGDSSPINLSIRSNSTWKWSLMAGILLILIGIFWSRKKKDNKTGNIP